MLARLIVCPGCVGFRWTPRHLLASLVGECPETWRR